MSNRENGTIQRWGERIAEETPIDRGVCTRVQGPRTVGLRPPSRSAPRMVKGVF